VCEGAAANRHLGRDRRPAPTSSLTTSRAFDELVAALRVNTALQRVDIAQERGFPAEQREPVLDLLRTYNFALQSVHMAARWLMLTRSYQIPIDELLQHNCFVKGVVERLEGAEYHISRRAVWPALMQEFVTISTLLYRFVRRGNLEQFAEQAVLVGAAAAETPNDRKRSRDQLQPPSGVRAEFAVSGVQSSFRTAVAVTIGFDNLPGALVRDAYWDDGRPA
jgi:hypothetical protein